MEELLELIHRYAPIGSLVVDCFAGTCSVAKACLRLHRRCYCIEKDKDLVICARRSLTAYYRWLVSNNVIIQGGIC